MFSINAVNKFSGSCLTKKKFSFIILIEIDIQFLHKNYKHMQSNPAVKFAPIFSDEKKVEITLDADQAVIKLSTWTEDLGWCGQKTLSLDAAMLDDLHRVITAARLKLNRQKAENEIEQSSENNQTNDGKILRFPNFS